MRIIKVTNGPLMQNCYILAGKDKAIVIDPGIDTKKNNWHIKQKQVKANRGFANAWAFWPYILG